MTAPRSRIVVGFDSSEAAEKVPAHTSAPVVVVVKA